MREHEVAAVDPFELPEWLGVEEVAWTAHRTVDQHLLSGQLAAGDRSVTCDVLACDRAYPMPVLGDTWRSSAHQAWVVGEALLVEYDGRLTVAVPGSVVTVELALEAVRRLAKAVGAPVSHFSVCLQL